MLLDITPLKVSRDYRLLFFGQLVSFFGSMMTFIVVPWQIYELTGSSSMVGYIYLVEFVPMLVLAFVGGALADYFEKRKLLRITEFGQTLASILLLINSLLPQPTISVLFLCVAVHSGLSALQRPAFEAFIQKVIPAQMMAAVTALNSIRWSLGAIVSPAIAGIVAVKLGPTFAYAFDVLTFSATIYALFKVKAIPRAVGAERPGISGILRAIRYAASRQEILGTYFIDFAAMFFAMPQALYPALATTFGREYVGFFPACLAAGALLGSITSGWSGKIERHGLFVIISAICWGVAITLFGLAGNIILALVLLAAAGYFDMISGIFRGAIWNQTIPNFLRGRMASLEMISYLSGPMLGSAKMGIVAETFGTSMAIVSGGILCVISVLLASLFLPKFLSYKGQEGIKQRELEETRHNELARLCESEF
ncbi:MAG TPA: MFS transporter [Pyrinomonadaceae bacterium]|nr:MFS transporter [Pyrinomonadaceae bacterium]